MTFFEAYEKWFDGHKNEVKQTTAYAYYSMGKAFSRIIDRDADICTLNETTMKACFAKFRDAGASNHYLSDLLRMFRMVMRFAGSSLGVTGLPSLEWNMKDVTTGRIKGTARQRVKRFTIAEYDRMIKVFEDNPTPGRLAIVITMFTGIRIGEACGLKFSDIDFDEGVIHIQRTRVRTSKSFQKILRPGEDCATPICTQSPKSASSDRYIPMIPKLRKILQSYAKVFPGDYFISSLSTKPTDTRVLRSWYEQMLKAANVPYLNYHCMRHTFATQMIEKGIDVKTVSSILGHASVEITMDTYCHPSDDTKRASIQKAFRGLLK